MIYVCVCVCEDDFSDTTTPRHKSKKPEAEISYAKMGPLTEK